SSGMIFNSLSVGSNAWLRSGTVNLTVNNNAIIQAGGGILTDALGNPGGTGNGFGRASGIFPLYACSGAGHGGYGAISISNSVVGGITYDTSTSPSLLGSGGGNYSPYSIGGAGGGYVRLTVNNLLQVDGVISAN